MATIKNTRMDAQGRILIPPHIRKELNLNACQLVAVSLDGDAIKIQVAEERCAFCGGSVKDRYIIGPRDTMICRGCALTVARKIQKEEENS